MSKLATAEVCLEGVQPRLGEKSLWTSFSQNLREFRCRLIHKSISRPVNGKYRCWTCLQEFDSNW